MPPENARYNDRTERDRNDLILMPRQFAWGKDLTRGNLTVYAGPHKVTVSDTTERLVVPRGDGLDEVADLFAAIQSYASAAEGEYVVLLNPADNDKHPEPEMPNKVVPLRFGRKVNLPGPVSFALWPFQHVTVIKGHQLQMNQYVIVRVVNDEEAAKNWDKAIVKPQTTTDTDVKQAQNTQDDANKSVRRPDNLSVGQLLIIKGTDVSFYIPPTGLEVVPDERGLYVREAVTLEQLEYCVLVDQNGDKRFERGPKVVFPKPSETFKTYDNDGQIFRKFKAIELTQISGLHIKVTAPYEEGGKKYQVGEELFITGADQPIYFPRAEHAIIRYDGRDVHYATAVPRGDGKYVLDRFAGDVSLVKGPIMLLPDPRTQVLVRRILSDRQVKLWYPNNTEALRVNQELAQQASSSIPGMMSHLDEDDEYPIEESVKSLAKRRSSFASPAPTRLVGDDMGRKSTYTAPRTITLNSKYEGAVSIDVWTGYAILVVDRSGKRKVVTGPETVLLEFDETLAYMGLSTGKPKNTDSILETAYLRVLNNVVSDIVSVETMDSVQAKVRLSYRVNFTGDSDKWFDVENYVKLLCDHARSLIRNMVKKIGIQDFNAKYIDLIRDTILGQPEGAEGEKKKRRGLLFTENGMHVFDVELLGLEIGNSSIAQLLMNAQHKAVQDTLLIAQNERDLEMARKQETIARETNALIAETALQRMNLERIKIKAESDVILAKHSAQETQAAEELKAKQMAEKVSDVTHGARLAREKLTVESALMAKKAEIALEIERLVGESTELVKRTEAVTPAMIAALQAFGDKAMVEKMAEAMAPMALLGGTSVAEVLSRLLKGSGLEELVPGVAGGLASRLTPLNSTNSRS